MMTWLDRCRAERWSGLEFLSRLETKAVLGTEMNRPVVNMLATGIPMLDAIWVLSVLHESLKLFGSTRMKTLLLLKDRGVFFINVLSHRAETEIRVLRAFQIVYRDWSLGKNHDRPREQMQSWVGEFQADSPDQRASIIVILDCMFLLMVSSWALQRVSLPWFRLEQKWGPAKASGSMASPKSGCHLASVVVPLICRPRRNLRMEICWEVEDSGCRKVTRACDYTKATMNDASH